MPHVWQKLSFSKSSQVSFKLGRFMYRHDDKIVGCYKKNNGNWIIIYGAKSFEYDNSKTFLAVNQDININDLLKNLNIEDMSLEIEELKKNIQDKSLKIEELKNKNKDMMLEIENLKEKKGAYNNSDDESTIHDNEIPKVLMVLIISSTSSKTLQRNLT
ncbi:hypothetical protein F8M41_005429 [Gigaspora margarita]|uniref:Uncharacterized protein n=1 Tax=Gigaspora margarita TaxID=4874 RepID=A0A8H4AX74_GIGMA|nr:hypothetical protein F8M41_005429 [Gigaspora margarita]